MGEENLQDEWYRDHATARVACRRIPTTLEWWLIIHTLLLATTQEGYRIFARNHQSCHVARCCRFGVQPFHSTSKFPGSFKLHANVTHRYSLDSIGIASSLGSAAE